MSTTTPLLGAGNVTSSANGASKTLTLTKPSNLSDGYYMFAAIIYRNTGGTWTLPSGWTEIGVTAQDYVDCRVYYKYVADSSAETATDYSWTVSIGTAADRILGFIWLQSNAAISDVIDAVGTAQITQPNRTSMNLPAVTASDNSATLIAIEYSSLAGGATAPVGSTPPGMTEITNLNASNSVPNSLNLKASYQILSGSGSTGTRTTTFSPAANGSGGFMFTITPGTGASAVTLILMRQALPETDTIRVLSRTIDVAMGARLAVSASDDMTSPVYSDMVMPDSDGYAKHTVTGLDADTQYFFTMELDGVLQGQIGQARTFQTSGTAQNFSFGAASCTNTGSNNAIFDAIRTRVGPDSLPARFFSHLGDVHYAHASFTSNPVAPNDPAEHRANYEASLSTARQAALWRDIPLSHTYSDNDFCGSNSDSTAIGRPAVIQVRHQIIMDPALPDSQGNGLWYTWVIGRVRFIRTDARTYMAAKGSTDNSSKSMLGLEQKAWLKAQLLQPEPLKVWFHDNLWTGPAVTPGGGTDNYTVFNTERTEIGKFIRDNDVKVFFIHGDTHRLSADSGVGNQWGNFPVVSVAPMDMTGNPADSVEAYSEGVYPLMGSGNVQQYNYGWFDVTDNGTNITIAFKGYDSGGTARVTMTRTFPGTPQYKGWNQKIA